MAKTLKAGSSISHYRIVSKIGAGGMGEVYLADDTRLRRKVALKVLPENIAADADRLLRFEREAFAASGLNHPNILTIFEFGEAGKTHFLASEFVAGESLRERMNGPGMTIAETLEIAIQIASALQAAHEAGIIHRDIKPDNVMIRADGYVKVLDFGLAKLTEQPAAVTASDSSEEATRMQLQTQAGMIMGTVAYMSPEQARGHEVDKRTDVWSLGCVLYEMLTRQQPFRGETTADALANIIHRGPVPLLTLRQDANAELERIVNLALSKDIDERYQTAKDFLGDLKQLQKRLEFEAELERSSAPSIKKEAQTQVIHAPTTAQNTMRNSIAVLPFSNLSADPDNDYFCDGLAEELLGALTKIDDLRVAARSSAFSFKGRNINVSEIGRTLSVKTVLEGSVRKSGERVRISVQLVNAADGYHLWSERYDREMKDIFDVQDEITLAVVDALKVKLLGEKKEELLKRYTQNAEAYQLYLRGRFFFFKRTPEGFNKAIEYFQQAIQLDAEYALAYSGLADCYTFLGFYEHLAPVEAESNLKGPAFKSLELDDTLAETRTSVALYKSFYQWEFVEADKEHKRAIALNPKYAFAHHLDSATVILLGRNNDAIAAETRAVELEPFTAIFNASLGWWFYLARQNEEAIAQSLRTIEIAPNHFFAHWVLGLAYGLAEKYDDAIAVLKKGLSLTSAQHIKADLARIYAQSGRREEALAGLSELRQEAKQQYVSAVNLAKIYLGLGEVEKVYEQLEQAVAERAVKLPWFMLDPMLDQLRAEPRFRDLWRRIGLPENETAQPIPTEASEAHTVVFDSAEHRSGKPVSPEMSGPDRPVHPNSPADPEFGGAEPIRNSPSTTLPDISRPTTIVSGRRKNVLLIALTISVVALATVGYWFFGNRGGGQFNSIAVMPFVNESGNADVEYLSDGMTETLIRSLSQLPNVNVKARSSVFRYKGKATDAKTVGKELNVQAILNGRVVQRGDQLTLSLELIDARTENVIWTDRYDRRSSDLVSLQNEIARDVSSKLKAKLSGTDKEKLEKNYTTNAEAYRLYLQGRFYWNKREEKDFRKAVAYYNQAIALDQNYALAYAGLADTYALLSTFGFMPPTEGVPKARELASQAVSLDGGLAEPHTTLGYLSLTYDYDFVGSEREFRRSIELNPNYATAHQWYGEMLLNAGRFDEASAEYRRALEIEPLSLPINWDYGRFLYMSRRYDESLAQHKKTIELDSGFARAHRTLAEVYRVKGDYADAVEERAKFFDLIGQPQSAALIRATFAKDGWHGFLRLVTAENSPLKDSNNNWVVAKAYVDLGDKDKAFAELNKAYEVRLSSLCWLKVEPQLDPLRSDPRYQELLRKMRFPQ